jgi:hypothetical protein
VPVALPDDLLADKEVIAMNVNTDVKGGGVLLSD